MYLIIVEYLIFSVFLGNKEEYKLQYKHIIIQYISTMIINLF